MKKNQKALIRHNMIWTRLNTGETVNVKALAEEFGEWFMDYNNEKDIDVMCLEVLSEQ